MIHRLAWKLAQGLLIYLSNRKKKGENNMKREEIERQAREAAEILGVNDKNLINILKALEKKGVKIYWEEIV